MGCELSTASLNDLYSYITNTYDGNTYDDSFQNANCVVYSGIHLLHKVPFDGYANRVSMIGGISEDQMTLEGFKRFEKATIVSDDDDDENLLYKPETDGDNEHDQTFIFTKKNNLRLSSL